ncbi:polysaccharide deacetylase family protein [uncultured Psychroserpens sp.]|uniref:polysaccharide deacetylase family protein n=1 Tax=uncultured Psychroserpens sp. TaxID=255436 RepID=UPI00260E3DC2|nr:polysaccharide deacetylase family protein [uncultured Psychroserpens sp.]
MFPNYIWNMPTTEKELYLTFDDGPTPIITEWTLDILKQYDAKATFFCIGSNIEKHPEIFKQIVNQGHTIGNHTHHHVKGWKSKTKNYLNDVAKAKSVIDSTSDSKSLFTTPLFRPPYGQIKVRQGKQLTELGYKIIMWDVLSFDWDQNVSEAQCYSNVISKSKEGSIIVFHDSIKASKNMMYALPKMLKHFNDKGYKFRALKF